MESGPEFTAAHISVSGEGNSRAATDSENLTFASTTAITDHSLVNGRLPTSVLGREALWTDGPDDRERPVPGFNSKALPESFSVYLDEAEMPPFDQPFKANTLTHLGALHSNHQSAHADETASVSSDLTMSSGAAASRQSSVTSDSRRRKCHKCQKAAQAASPLFRCSKCPRRYHSHCAVPKIPSNSQV